LPPPWERKAESDSLSFVIRLFQRPVRRIFDSDGVTTPGTLHLYKDILNLQEEELRDVFERIALFAKIFNRVKGVANLLDWKTSDVLRPRISLAVV